MELCVVTVNEKPWAGANEVCRALMYNKETGNIVKNHCSKENYSQKYQMSGAPAAVTPVDWPKNSQKFDIYVNEEGMYKLLFSSQQPKTKEFRKHCCNVMFPHVRQQLTNKMKEDHQQAIEEKDAAIALVIDYKIVTIRFKPSNVKTWHCKHKEMCIRPSYKNVKTPSSILKHVMFLMQEIPVKTKLSSLY